MNSSWIQVDTGHITGADIAAWPYSVSILVRFTSFLTTLHWPSGPEDLGRMRSWWRHEQVSIAAAVATALHHSAQCGGGVARRPTGTEDSGNRGTRPGVLKDPANKRKKRRKKKLPKTSSSRGSAHRRQRQWQFQCWLRWFSAHAVSSSLVGRPKLPGIMDGMDQICCICARRRPQQWLIPDWFAGFVPRAVFLFVVVRPKMLRIMAGMTQRDSFSLVFLVLHLALCSFLSFAGPRCSASWLVWTRRTVKNGKTA